MVAGWQLPTSPAHSTDEPGLKENPKKLLTAIFFNGFPIVGKLPDFFFYLTIFLLARMIFA